MTSATAVEIGKQNVKSLVQQFRAAFADGDVEVALELQRRLWRASPGVVPKRSFELPLMNWEAGEWQPADPRWATPPRGYLFVSGSARSGTTALGRLLNLHPRIAMFIELYDPSYGYVPQMLEHRNIRTLIDRGILSLNERNQAVLERAPTARFIGDKRPAFLRAHALTLTHFAERPVTIVHAARRIHDVAHSYIVRATTGSWAESRDHRVAVDDLNLNNRTALALLDGLAPPHRLIPIRYSSFWTDAANARRLFELVGVRSGRADWPAVTKMFNAAADLREKARPLTDAVRTYIDAHYDFGAEEELARRCVL